MKAIVIVCLAVAFTFVVDGFSTSVQEDGEVLAQQYCQSCHLLPVPDDLDKATWIAKVFPMMRRFMGLDPTEITENMPHAMKNFFPEHPAITEDEWFEVAQWYVDSAPVELPRTQKPALHKQTTFKAVAVEADRVEHINKADRPFESDCMKSYKCFLPFLGLNVLKDLLFIIDEKISVLVFFHCHSWHCLSPRCCRPYAAMW